MWKSDTVGKQPNGGREAFEKEQEGPQLLGTLKVLERAHFKMRPKEAWPQPGNSGILGRKGTVEH